MKIYKTLKELKKDVVNNVLRVEGDVIIEFNLDYPGLRIEAQNIKARGDIEARDIDAWSITARGDVTVARDIKAWGYITAWDINAQNIKAWNINAQNIEALNIEAWNINAQNIEAADINAQNITVARDIKAWNIIAQNINAQNINYYAICCAYENISCNSIKGRRKNCRHYCLNGEITIKDK